MGFFKKKGKLDETNSSENSDELTSEMYLNAFHNITQLVNHELDEPVERYFSNEEVDKLVYISLLCFFKAEDKRDSKEFRAQLETVRSLFYGKSSESSESSESIDKFEYRMAL